MFVRWKRRPAKRARSWSVPDEQAHYAVLVESRRVDGKPRQRVVKHLSAIRDGDLVHPLTVERFWQQVDAGLDEMSVSGPARLAAESTINSVVPRPDPEILERTRQGFEAWKAGVSALAESMASRRRR